MNFQDLQDLLIDHLRAIVQSGEFTERGLSRITGISQPHIHNVLKRKRSLSPQRADKILRRLHVDLRDLIPPAEAGRRPIGS